MDSLLEKRETQAVDSRIRICHTGKRRSERWNWKMLGWMRLQILPKSYKMKVSFGKGAVNFERETIRKSSSAAVDSGFDVWHVFSDSIGRRWRLFLCEDWFC